MVRAGVARDEVAAHDLVGRLADDDRARRRHRLQARGEIDRLALRRVVHAQVVADAPDDDGSGIDPDAQRELEPAGAPQRLRVLANRVLDGEARRDGPDAMILVRDRRPEQGHDAVARELVDGAFVPMDRFHDAREAAVHDRVQLFGIEPGGEAVNPAQSANSTVTCFRSPSSALARLKNLRRRDASAYTTPPPAAGCPPVNETLESADRVRAVSTPAPSSRAASSEAAGARGAGGV